MFERSLRLLTLFMSVGSAFLCMSAETKKFSVTDSIEMTRFNIPNENLRTDDPSYSPDRTRFIVITSVGNVKTNEIESTIWVYNVKEVRAYLDHGGLRPSPRKIANARAVPDSEVESAHAPVVTQLKWMADSRGFYFLRETTAGKWQLCRILLADAKVEYLTSRKENVRIYSFARSTVAYVRTYPTRLGIGATRIAVGGGDVTPPSIRGRTLESLILSHDPSEPVMAQLCELIDGGCRTLGMAYEDSGFGGSHTPDLLSVSPDDTLSYGLVLLSEFRHHGVDTIPRTAGHHSESIQMTPMRIQPTTSSGQGSLLLSMCQPDTSIRWWMRQSVIP